MASVVAFDHVKAVCIERATEDNKRAWRTNFMIATLLHFPFAVSDLDQGGKFYGEPPGGPEGRKHEGRADFSQLSVLIPAALMSRAHRVESSRV